MASSFISLLSLILGAVVIAALIEPWFKRSPIPFTALLVILGFIGSELWTAAGFDTGLRWDNFRDIILHLLVPILVFESAFHMPTRLLLRNSLAVFLLAIPALLLSATISGYLLFYAIGYPQGFPLLTALLAGVILAATDPVAVVAMFKSLGASPRLTALVEGESLFNDATAVVCFTLILLAFDQAGAQLDWQQGVLQFAITLTGGILIGLIFGYLASFVYRLTSQPIKRGIISCLAMALPFYIAEYSFHVSGIVAVLITGLWLGEINRSIRTNNDKQPSFSGQLWQLNGYIANIMVFILMGITITLDMFQEQWLAMLLGIGIASLSRAVGVYGVSLMINQLPKQDKISWAYQNVMMWGGLRGGVGIALALSIPTTIPAWYSVQSIVYGMVLFTLFVQAPLMPYLIKKTL